MWPFLPYGVFPDDIVVFPLEEFWKLTRPALSHDMDPTRNLQGTVPDVPTE